MDAGTEKGTGHLWGFCKTCEYADLCRGGCSWTAHVFFNRKGNNPYCHHRSLVQAANGKREDFIIKRSPLGLPFDNGEFSIEEKPFDAKWPMDEETRLTADKIQWPQEWLDETPDLAHHVEKEVDKNINAMRRYLKDKEAVVAYSA